MTSLDETGSDSRESGPWNSESPLPASPLFYASAGLAEVAAPLAPVVEISRTRVVEFLEGNLIHLSPLLLGRLGALLRGPILDMSKEERERLREKTIAKMLENKAKIIAILRKRLEATQDEDKREEIAEELYAWLQENLKERLINKPGGTAGPGLKVSTCAADCVKILARVIYAEAAGASDGVKGAMGWVVINRVRDTHREFKNLATCREVIMAPRAFSSVGSGLWNEAGNPAALRGAKKRAYDKSRAIAAQICSGTLKDPTKGALLYYSPQSMKPPGSVPPWDFKKLEEVKIPGTTNGALKLFRYK